MNEFKLKDVILGYIDAVRQESLFREKISQYVYAWIIKNYKLYDYNIPTQDQIGRAYIGPNPKFCEDPNECKGKWGWHWDITNDGKGIRINWNTIKNQWLDIDEENEITFTFTDFINEFTK